MKDTSQVTQSSTQVESDFWLQWMLASMAALPVSYVLITLERAGRPQFWQIRPLLGLPISLASVAAVGLFQWTILRRYIDGAFWWIVATVAGFGITRIVGSVLFFAMSSVYSALIGPVASGFVGALLGGVLSAVILGGAQWLVLGRHVYRAGWWILVVAAVLFAEYAGLSIIGVLTGEDPYSMSIPFARRLSGTEFVDWYFLLLELPAAAISGRVLMWLLQQPLSEEDRPPHRTVETRRAANKHKLPGWGRVTIGVVIVGVSLAVVPGSYIASAILVRSGERHATQGETEAAWQEYTDALKVRPFSSQAYVGRALLYLENGQLADALNEVEIALALAPGNPEAHFVRGAIYAELEEWQSSISNLNRALELGLQHDLDSEAQALLESVSSKSLGDSPDFWPIVIADSFDSNIHKWHTGTLDDGSVRISWQLGAGSGEYVWSVDAIEDTNWRVWPDVASVADFYVAVDAEQVSGSQDAAYGLVFRVSDENNLYYYGVSNSGYYNFHVLEDGERATLVDWTESTAIRPGEVNRLAASGVGSHLTLFINGEQVDEIHDNRLSTGKAGIAVTVFAGDEATFRFDDFIFRSP